MEHVYSERPLRLPDGYVCYSPPPYAPDVVPLPALANGHITFGCFNNLAKITPRVIATWCAILHRVPDARLVLKTQQFSDEPTAERVRAAFAAHGIATGADRAARPASGHRAFLGEYNDIDIVLDPFPYSGGLTTCEALWMGVPTVALPGEIFASRHSHEPSEQCRPCRLGRAAMSPPMSSLPWPKPPTSRARRAARRAARAGQGKPALRCAALRPQPRHALRVAWRDWCSRS